MCRGCSSLLHQSGECGQWQQQPSRKQQPGAPEPQRQEPLSEAPSPQVSVSVSSDVQREKLSRFPCPFGLQQQQDSFFTARTVASPSDRCSGSRLSRLLRHASVRAGGGERCGTACRRVSDTSHAGERASRRARPSLSTSPTGSEQRKARHQGRGAAGSLERGAGGGACRAAEEAVLHRRHGALTESAWLGCSTLTMRPSQSVSVRRER